MIPGMDRLGAGAVDRAGCKAFCGHMGDVSPRWCSARCCDLELPPLAPTPPANVSPPSPAPGQRWRGDILGTRLKDVEFDLVDVVDSERIRIGVPSAPEFGTELRVRFDWFGGYRYLGPVPAAPGAVAPASIPTVAALGSGPPDGYAPCERKCGRWTFKDGRCWTCLGDRIGGVGQTFPDWTPSATAPAPAPAPRPTRTPGITCRRCLLTSAGGVDHQPTCVVMRERGPSAVAAAPERQRDTFHDLVDEFDLLPEAGR